MRTADNENTSRTGDAAPAPAGARREKITDGANDRPVDESIGQSAGGLPDDSAAPVEVSEAEARRIEETLKDR